MQMPFTVLSRIWIVLSIVITLLLTQLPLPREIQWYLPQWIPLLLLYWALTLPQRISISSAWITGLLMDVLNDTSLGEHALALTVMTFIAVKWHRQFRMFPVVQQILVIFGLTWLYLILLFLIQGLQGYPINDAAYWITVPITTACWPLIVFILQHYQDWLKIN